MSNIQDKINKLSALLNEDQGDAQKILSELLKELESSPEDLPSIEDFGIPVNVQGKKHPNEQIRGMVLAMSSNGTTQGDICLYTGMDRKTLKKHYQTEIDKGRIFKTNMAAERLFEMGMAPKNTNPSPLIFWLKCQSRGGWVESGETVEELKEKGIGKIQIEVLPSNEKKDVVTEDKVEEEETIQ